MDSTQEQSGSCVTPNGSILCEGAKQSITVNGVMTTHECVNGKLVTTTKIMTDEDIQAKIAAERARFF
jgi:hypothetical protein